MKKIIIPGAAAAVFGLLIALGPLYIFKVCSSGCSCCSDMPPCNFTANAELGLGFVIAALGLCMILFTNVQTHFGLALGIFFSGIVALFVPHVLIGGCALTSMACHRIAFPALTVITVLLLAASAAYIIYIAVKKKAAD
ncbi:MAG: DUF4418 family protein [Treponema sp.]|nr:DUF4418 family protein [Treponema sp.]MCL2272656.1 DUF4418 family protein [Treponema sp.]